jgi:hypothetical protein
MARRSTTVKAPLFKRLLMAYSRIPIPEDDLRRALDARLIDDESPRQDDHLRRGPAGREGLVDTIGGGEYNPKGDYVRHGQRPEEHPGNPHKEVL